MVYLLASERWRKRDRSTPAPAGVGHLMTQGQSSTVCGRAVGDLYEFPWVPIPGNYFGRYGCGTCKSEAGQLG